MFGKTLDLKGKCGRESWCFHLLRRDSFIRAGDQEVARFLSVRPINLKRGEAAGGIEEEADELTFSFSSVSYLGKNPADLFSHISSLQTPLVSARPLQPSMNAAP